MTTNRPQVDVAAVKGQQQATRESGDVSSKITVNHNTSVVRVSQAK